MANDPALANSPAAVNSATVTLFQKAHAKMVTLQRVDEQLQSLFDQRRKLQDELRGVQALINEEFDRVVRETQDGPAARATPTPYADVANGKSKRNGSSKNDTIRLEVVEAV